MVLEQWNIHMQKNLDTDFIKIIKSSIKIISKWTTDLNVKHKTVRLLERQHRNIDDL